MSRMVALLRAVNVGGRKLPMADLRRLCVQLGWQQVSTYIQSGNVVFSADADPGVLESALEKAIQASSGLRVPVIIRSAEQWALHAGSPPFPAAAEESPSRLMLILSKTVPSQGAGALIQARADSGEEVAQVGEAIWLHYPKGLGRSKLNPTLIDRAIGSPSTARNYRTVMKLADMLAS